MADSDWMGGAGLGLQALATALQGYGAYSGGQVQQQGAYYNAGVMQQRGQIAIAQAGERAAIQQTITGRSLGEQKAQAGASGVDANQGSPLAVMADTASQGELQRQLLLYQGQMENFADQQQAQLDIASGNAAATAGTNSAVGTLLTGGAKVAYGASQLYGGRAGTVPASLPTGPYNPTGGGLY